MIRDLVAAAVAVVVVMAVFTLMLLYLPVAQGAELGCGIASRYGLESCQSTPCRTASGSRFTGRDMTAAMPSRAMLGKHVKVTLVGTRKSIVVLVNDLGPALRLHRIIDLSTAAAHRLGFSGLAQVCLERIDP